MESTYGQASSSTFQGDQDVDDFTKFLVFSNQIHKSFTDSKRILHGVTSTVERTLHNSAFKMAIEVGISMFFEASSSVVVPQASSPISNLSSSLTSTFTDLPTAASNQTQDQMTLAATVLNFLASNNIPFSPPQQQQLNVSGVSSEGIQVTGSNNNDFSTFPPQMPSEADLQNASLANLAQALYGSFTQPVQNSTDSSVSKEIKVTSKTNKRKQKVPSKVVSSESSNDDKPYNSDAKKKAQKRTLEKNFPCSECCNSYASAKNLSTHMQKKHPNNLQTNDNNLPSTSFAFPTTSSQHQQSPKTKRPRTIVAKSTQEMEHDYSSLFEDFPNDSQSKTEENWSDFYLDGQQPLNTPHIVMTSPFQQ